MLSPVRIAVVGAAVVGLVALNLPSASAASSALTSSSCRGALSALAHAQRQGLASPTQLNDATSRCVSGPLTLPRAQFAVITDLESTAHATVGLVFSWTDVHSMSALNQEAPSYLLVNGTGVAEPSTTPMSLVRDHKATARIGSATYSGRINATLGDGGQLVVFRFDRPVGTIDKTQAQRAAVAPKTGSPVVVFTEAGPLSTKIGPNYSPATFSLDRKLLGIVTAPDGTYRGWSSEDGTGFVSVKATKFWAHRAMFVPYQGIPEKAVG